MAEILHSSSKNTKFQQTISNQSGSGDQRTPPTSKSPELLYSVSIKKATSNQIGSENKINRPVRTPSYTLTKESKNFSRVCRLLLDVGTDVLKEYFDKIVPNEKLCAHLNSNKEKLQKLACLRRFQKQKLFPTQEIPTSSDFDICLLYLLLRETCNISPPKTKWGNPPETSDISVGAYIERLRQARNELFAHALRATLADEEFDAHWKEISDAIIGLGGHAYIKIIDRLHSESLNVLDVSRHRIDAQMQRILETVAKDDEYFIETRATKAAEKELKENGAVFMIGDPGYGKTSSAWHIILKCIQNGYELIVINEAEQFMENWHPQNKQLFFVDDCFGQSRAVPEKMERWRNLQKNLHNSINTSDTFIFATLRRLIYRELKDKLQGFELFGNLIDISDTSLKLTVEERTKIFRSYARGGVKDYDSSVLQTISASETPRFPLSCRLFFSKEKFKEQGSRFFLNPVNQLREDLTQLCYEDCMLFAALVLLLLCENKIDAKDLSNQENKKPPANLVEWIKAVCFFCSCYSSEEQSVLKKVEIIKAACNISKDKTLNDFRESLNTLRDIYVDFLDGKYTFIHQSILETVGVIIAKDNIELLIEQSSASFIQQRIRTKNCKFATSGINDESMIQISKENYGLLAHRLTEDVLAGDADIVFQNPSVSSYDFCNAWISHIKTLKSPLIRAFVSCVDRKGFSLMYWAARESHIDFLKFCIDIDDPPSDAIHGACYSGETEKVQLLISEGVDLNISDQTGATPLVFSCQQANTAIVELLISNGADVNKEQENLGSPLHVACWDQNIDLVKTLLANGAETNIVTSAGWPNIYFFAEGNNTHALQMLLKGNKSITLNSNTNWTPLHLASGKDETEIVQLLLSNGADVNYLTTKKWNPLFCAVSKKQYNIVNLLVHHGANPNQQIHFNMTALHRVCYDGHISIAKLLLDHGANVNAKSDAGYIPLHCTCEYGFKELALFLIRNGADVNAQGLNGKTPLAIAKEKNNVDIVQMIESLFV